MAPKRATTSAPKKTQSPLRQATLAFKATKRGAAAPSKAKAKAKTKSRTKSETESESEGEDESEAIVVEESWSEDEEEMSVKKEVLDMHDKARSFSKYYKEVKEKMGRMPPIHPEGQTKIHHMLRVFDNTYEFGPCVGMTRMERWERAQEMGLKPPTEVRDILLTEQGSKNEDLVHPVFYGLVL